MLSHFEGTRRDFVSGLLSQSRQAKIWFYLDIDRAVQQLNTDRGRVVRAMDFLAERGWMELKTSKVQHCYARLQTPDDLDALAADLYERCVRRQDQELGRLRQLLELMALNDCQTNALAAHFGEQRNEPCGHCHWCLEQTPIQLVKATSPPIDEAVWQQALQLRSQYPDALGTPINLTRFLCGVRSPGLTKAKLTREELFGQLAERSYAEVLERASGL